MHLGCQWVNQWLWEIPMEGHPVCTNLEVMVKWSIMSQMNKKSNTKSMCRILSWSDRHSSVPIFWSDETIDLKSQLKAFNTDVQWPTNFIVLKILGMRKCSLNYFCSNSSIYGLPHDTNFITRWIVSEVDSIKFCLLSFMTSSIRWAASQVTWNSLQNISFKLSWIFSWIYWPSWKIVTLVNSFQSKNLKCFNHVCSNSFSCHIIYASTLNINVFS